jgi:hypothetical protein
VDRQWAINTADFPSTSARAESYSKSKFRVSGHTISHCRQTNSSRFSARKQTVPNEMTYRLKSFLPETESRSRTALEKCFSQRRSGSEAAFIGQIVPK